MHRPGNAQNIQRDSRIPASQLYGFVKRRRPPAFTQRNTTLPASYAAVSSSALNGIVLPALCHSTSTINRPVKSGEAHPYPQVHPHVTVTMNIPMVRNAASQGLALVKPDMEHPSLERSCINDVAHEQVNAPYEELKEKPTTVLVEAVKNQSPIDNREPDKSNDHEQKPKETPEPEKMAEELEKEAKHKNELNLVLFQKTNCVHRKDEDGVLYSQEFMNHMRDVFTKHLSFVKYPLKIKQAAMRTDAESLRISGALSVLCHIIVEELQTKAYASEDSKVGKNHFAVLKAALSMVVNYSDCDSGVTYFLRDHETFLPAVLAQLLEWVSEHIANKLSLKNENCLSSCMSLLHNTAMREDNVSRLRQLCASDILMSYLESPKPGVKLSAYATLADIVTEGEADKLSTSPIIAQFLLELLQKALTNERHRCVGWSVTELVRAVRQLSRNDANKRLMVEMGVVPMLAQGVQSTFEDEKSGCMETIWVLSFDKQNVAEIIKCEDLMDQIVKAVHDHSQPSDVRQSANGILFQMRDALVKTDKYRDIGEEYFKTKRKDQLTPAETQASAMAAAPVVAAKEEKHIMLSYQWADQAVVKRIRDVLRSHGFRVWIDVDNMGGSTLQAMAEAIEDSFVVVVGISQKYKDSPNCRAEAEYAFQQQKNIVPLILQRGYRPDGWLGMILGAKLFYDFSGKYPFESRIGQLVRAVKEIGRQGNTTLTNIGLDEVDGKKSSDRREEPDVAEKFTHQFHGARHTTPPVNTTLVKSWSSAEVKSWLKKFSMDGTQLEKLTGKEIVFLHNLRSEAPEFFYNTLERKLQIQALSGLISFTDALDDLPSS